MSRHTDFSITLSQQIIEVRNQFKLQIIPNAN